MKYIVQCFWGICNPVKLGILVEADSMSEAKEKANEELKKRSKEDYIVENIYEVK